MHGSIRERAEEERARRARLAQNNAQNNQAQNNNAQNNAQNNQAQNNNAQNNAQNNQAQNNNAQNNAQNNQAQNNNAQNNQPVVDPAGVDYQIEEVAARAARRPGNNIPPSARARQQQPRQEEGIVVAPGVASAFFTEDGEIMNGFDAFDALSVVYEVASLAPTEDGSYYLGQFTPDEFIIWAAKRIKRFETCTVAGMILPRGEAMISLYDELRRHKVDILHPGELNWEKDLKRLGNKAIDVLGNVAEGAKFIPLSEKTQKLKRTQLNAVNPNFKLGHSTVVIYDGEIS